MKTVMALFTKYKFLLFVIAAAIFAGVPLLHPGLIPTHDGEYHLIRFFEFDKMLRLGYLYPRWAPDLNFSYGVPLFTYIYPLPNYVASLLHAFGSSFLDSVKLNMFLATLTGAVLCYFWIKAFWGEWGAATAAVLYTYAPYHFVDIYVRGSVGEVWALALFPGFLWIFTKFVATRKAFFAALSALFLALIIFSHNILGLMFFVFAISYIAMLIFRQKERRLLALYSIVIIFLSLGISSIFWIPALTETKYVTGLQIFTVSQNFPDLFQLLFPSWGTDFFGSSLGNEMSVQIGTVNLLIVFISIILFFKLNKKQSLQEYYFGFFLTWFVICFCLMLNFSLPLWIHVPLLHYFQFPWRLLSLVILICAFLSGTVVSLIKPKISAIIFIIFVILTTYAYTQPAYYMLRNDIYYITRSNFIDSTNSPGNVFTTIWDTTKTSRPKEKIVIKNDTSIKSFVGNQTNFSFTETTKNTIQQSIALTYFPGWIVRVDSRQQKTFPNNQGLLTFTLPKGTHAIHVQLQQTVIETISAIITGISLFLLTIFALRKKI